MIIDIITTSATPTFKLVCMSRDFVRVMILQDPQYELWVKENHPGSSDTDSLKTHVSNSRSLSTVSSKYLSDILQYPEPKVTSRAKKSGMNNSCAVCLSDSPVVKQLREKEER